MKNTFSVREISNQFKIPKKTILGYCLRNKLVPEYHNKLRKYILSFDELEALLAYYASKNLNKEPRLLLTSDGVLYNLYPSRLNYTNLNKL